jgi:hypothetical protein
MAWIESHQSIERHPKTIALMAEMGWDLDTTIGKLHRFWWWCIDYALDGNLSKFTPAILGNSVGLNGEDSVKFLETMIKVRFFDEKPFLRVHDWWDHIGLFLQRKYGEKNKAKWEAIRKSYEIPPQPIEKKQKYGRTENSQKSDNNCTTIVQPLYNGRAENCTIIDATNQPNQPNKPNQPDNCTTIVQPAENDFDFVRNTTKILADKILENNPGFLHLQPDRRNRTIDIWSGDMRRLIENDKRPVDEIITVIDFCQGDNFWKSVILSVKNLQDNYDKLLIKMATEKAVQSRAGKLCVYDKKTICGFDCRGCTEADKTKRGS